MITAKPVSPDVKLNYCFIETKEDLALCWDELADGITKMISKTGTHGQSPEIISRLIINTVGNPNTFLLTAFDEYAKFQGFLYATLIEAHPPWVDIIGLYTVPGIGYNAKDEVFTFLKAWARSKGAVKIMAGITRKHRVFFETFHRPLGFRQVGIIVEYDLEEDN